MVVAAREHRVFALIATAALLAGPLGSTPVGATLDSELECWPAEDGSDAYNCEIPEECVGDEDCQLPDECEQVDETTVRCEPPDTTYEGSETSVDNSTSQEDDNATRTSYNSSGDGLIYPSGDHDYRNASGSPVVRCGIDTENQTLVCELGERCRENTDAPNCRPPPTCERIDENLYRCETSEPRGVPDRPSAGHEQPASPPPSDGPRCEPGPERGTVVCTPPPECEGKIGETEFCTPPPECQARDDGTFLCEFPDRSDDARASAETGDLCEPGPEEGTVVCTPPAECEGKIGETEFCTPPPECEPRGDGTFLCKLSRHHTASEGSSSVPEAGEGLGEKGIFGDGNAEARAEARAAVADALAEAAGQFGSQLDEMRGEYEDRVDELRSEYGQGKAELRQAYEDCRADIPAGIDASEYNDRLRACLDEAREGHASLRARLVERHEQIKQSFKDRAEQARSQACEKAERAALNAIAEHGIFDTNPGDLMPERALDLCPSFADFGGGQG